jgi:hypothetical protein
VDPYASNLTEEARQSEVKVREGMLKAALKDISPFSGKPVDWLQWKDDTLACFTLAGRRMVLEENFRDYVTNSLGWSSEQVVDANRFVWTLLKSAVQGTKAANVFKKAPMFDGARAWWELRRKCEILGHGAMQKLENDLDKFQVKASEDPEDMIDRFEDLLEKYERFPTADKWTELTKLRELWKHCSKYSGLRLKVEMIKSDFTSNARTPERSTHEHVKNELIGQWLSFSGDPVDVDVKALDAKADLDDHSGSSDTSSSLSSNDVRKLGVAVDKLATKVANIDIQLAHAHAARDLGQGKKGGVQLACQALTCNEMSKAPPWRKNHLCRTCFQAFINDDSTPSIPLKEGRTMSNGE